VEKFLLSIWVGAFLLIGSPSGAQEPAAYLFHAFDGQWRGGGEVIAGKYKGTRFTCALTSLSDMNQIGLSLDGQCRMGIFSQRLRAYMVRGKNGTFSGQVNEGAKGDGLDITSGRIGSDHVMVDLYRDNVHGTMLAKLSDDNAMSITLSVKVSDHFIPVIGINLQRSSVALERNMAKK